MAKAKIAYAPFVPPSSERTAYSQPPGSLLEYAWTYPPGDRYHDATDPDPRIEWRKVEAWNATMSIEGIERGRSAARFIWRDADGRTFPMFMIDMLEVVKRGVNGTAAWWIVQKRGQNYGIRLATQEEISA